MRFWYVTMSETDYITVRGCGAMRFSRAKNTKYIISFLDINWNIGIVSSYFAKNVSMKSEIYVSCMSINCFPLNLRAHFLFQEKS